MLSRLDVFLYITTFSFFACPYSAFVFHEVLLLENGWYERLSLHRAVKMISSEPVLISSKPVAAAQLSTCHLQHFASAVEILNLGRRCSKNIL